MNLIARLFGKQNEEELKTEADYKRETLVNTGREQFQKLQELGLRAPVSLV